MRRRLSSLALRGVIFSLIASGAIIGQLVPAGIAQASGQPLDLVTSPLPITLATPPGSTVSTNIRVQQDGATTQELQVSLMKFGADGVSGKPALLSQGPGDTYFSWVSFSETKFEAAPNVWQNIGMTIHVPKTAAFDYYYAVVFSRVGDNTRKPGEVNSIQGGSAVLVILNAQVPWAKVSMSLASFTATHKIFEFLPASFNVDFNNTGNVHLVPGGDIFITQGKKQIAALDINSEQGNILADSQRTYPVAWSDGFPHYEPVIKNGEEIPTKQGGDVMHLVYSNGGADAGQLVPHLRFGEYTATLVATYQNINGDDVPINASLTFWVLPWRVMLIILAALLLIGFGVYAMVRSALRGASRLARKR